MSPWIAAHAASFIGCGMEKSGKPCARLIAPCWLATRVISRITDSWNVEARCAVLIMMEGGAGICLAAEKLARPQLPCQTLIADEGLRAGRVQQTALTVTRCQWARLAFSVSRRPFSVFKRRTENGERGTQDARPATRNGERLYLPPSFASAARMSSAADNADPRSPESSAARTPRSASAVV